MVFRSMLAPPTLVDYAMVDGVALKLFLVYSMNTIHGLLFFIHWELICLIAVERKYKYHDMSTLCFYVF